MSANSSSLPKTISNPRAVSGARQSVTAEHHLGRSFIYSSFRPDPSSPLNSIGATVHSSSSINETSVGLADVGVDSNDEPAAFWGDLNNTPPDQYAEDYAPLITEDSLKDGYQSTNSYPDETYSSYNGDIEAQEIESNSVFNVPAYQKYEQSSRRESALETVWQTLWAIRNADAHTIGQECIVKPIQYLPAVFLGTLLNILDGLSYGMILFPIGETVFSEMGAHGLSMFYVSTVVSQLVYSLGGSAFKSGIGSEMIEVTPFFHQMGISIMTSLGDQKDAVLATTIVTYAISSIVTGLVFFILGKCRLGRLVGFFPRHILVGCIGGVGYFLVVTAIEVSSRLEGGLEYNLPTLQYLLYPLVFCQWFIPLVLTSILVVIQHYNSSAIIVPLYFIAVFVIFHGIVYLVPSWDLQIARDYGWVFSAPKTETPWYSFYQFYKFDKVSWLAVLDQVPTMLALTFFGILHVPINVPALAVTVEMDEFDVDRELMAHGLSNAISGLCGSIQNYLVYTNSVLFIRAGADSRLSGVMLAMATACVMWAGPVIIGYIPVAVVGALIYLLGYELLKEALYDTKGKLRKFEYITILIIVVTMGAWDFVYGILVGVLLACVSFVVEAAKKPVVSGIYTGEYARSIVVRHPKQQEFLKDVGKQIYVMKLQGSLFFGSIGGLEEKVRARFEASTFAKEPIKYLILDMNNIRSIDFSAVEGFRRIRNLVTEKDSYMIISSVNENSEIVQALKDSGLWETSEHQERIQLFSNLNSALEWCENIFLEAYKELSKKNEVSRKPRRSIAPNPQMVETMMSGSPRHAHLMRAVRKTMDLDLSKRMVSTSGSTGKNPLSLVVTVMQGVSDNRDEQFWSRLVPYLVKQELAANQVFYEKQLNQPCLYFVESGMIGYDICFNNLKFFLNSWVLPLTLFGDLVKTQSDRVVRYYSNTESIVWKLDEPSIRRLKQKDRDLYEELLVVTLRLFTSKFDSLSSNILVSS
ncbi:hypothetical protein OGAPHI_006215 [Ogataea philodendri]|uniref:STAS domain-containing protein n=2 Tax=Saccharomycotina TaxID=147537 RepID=A0A9P8NYY1_9ASCO|nr:uncharacterized protein OGAPHI_006215 [Ogataea philodendri]KAH3662034.1 hypothetical protein OGAPHI_006215 [Ogataea philodendri]